MRAVAFGPSLVDINAKLPSEDFNNCLDLLGIRAGDWKQLASTEELEAFSRIIVGDNKDVLHNPPPGVSIAAGSSVLGMLVALETEVRVESTMVSAVAINKGISDEMSNFFVNEVHNMGVSHHAVLAEGANPLGFVINSVDNPEKILVNYPGVASEITEYNFDQHTDPLVVIDAYELQEGKLALLLEEIIDSRRYKIALSLGNRAILGEGLAARIRSYIADDKIFVVCGNDNEYEALYPNRLDPEDLTTFLRHPIVSKVPFSLVTFGPQGLVAGWDGKIIRQDAFPIDSKDIVNTSGAGDTAAGAFFSGIIQELSAEATLDRAAYLATKTLQESASLFIAPQ